MFERGVVSLLAEAVVPGIATYMAVIIIGLVLFLRTNK
jgi:hypothetical protein